MHLVGDVGIGVQGEARAVVAQDAGDGFGVDPLLDGQGCEGVTEAVERDVLGDSSLFQRWVTCTTQLMRPADLEMVRV